MGHIDWARAAQFNWVFDNMGGAPLQEAVAGNWQGATATVAADGRITLRGPNPGGGQVYYLRGVYRADTEFPWSGFWADPMSGDLTNYYTGGSFSNQEEVTCITLGTPLPAETQVQLYYIYLTGELAAKYEPLNDYPCIRRAERARDDYTYDFAVDRMLDLMACLHAAGPVQGKDYDPLIQYLWDAFVCRQQSNPSPLMQDSFGRQLWDRGPYLMYRGASCGTGAFQVFQTEAATGSSDRLLHVRAALPAGTDAAWFGYGLDWSLAGAPFNRVDRLSFRLQGAGQTQRLHNLTKIGTGSATLVLKGDYTRQEKRRFVVEIQSTGAVGQATFQWSKDGGLTWEAGGLISGDQQHPVALWAGLEVYWDPGSGTHLVTGDYWSFWAGEPMVHPRRLLVTLNDSTPDLEDPWDPVHTYVHAIPDRFAELTDFELPFSQFWRRDNLIEDGDRVTAMWGAWYSATQQDDSDLTIDTREETEVLEGDTFYTQRLVTWDLSPYATAFGVWAGIDPSRCDSSGHSQMNFLVQAVVAGVSALSLRVKLKDAQGSYFHKDMTIAPNVWQRLTVAFSELQLESGSAPLVHPIQVIDIGIPSAPPSNGAFYLTDLKFGEHLSFAGAQRLRTLEFKLEQQGLEQHEWWLDDVSLNLEADDPYPYAPRLAISLTPYGLNPWRGPTLVHYAQPLAPFLAGAVNLAQTYGQLHADAQDEFHQRYGGVKGPIVPVHTRNDIENIALCGCEDFTRFTWWPKYRNYGKVSGAWHFNESLVDAVNAYALSWSSRSPVYGPGVCQPGNTALVLDGSAHGSLDSNENLEPGLTDFSLTIILKGSPQAGAYQWLLDKMGADGWVIQSKGAGDDDLQLKVTTSAGDSYADIADVLDGEWHMLTWMVSFTDGKIYKVKDGVLLGNDALAVGTGLLNTAYLNIGSSGAFSLDYFKYERRMIPANEYENTWDIVQGNLLGSVYPEIGYDLGQYWAFMKLCQYYFITGDSATWTILDNWLTWFNTYGLMGGWTFPANAINLNSRIIFGSAWNAVDLGTNNDVPAGTKAVILFIRNLGTSGTPVCNVRATGSTKNLTGYLSFGRFTYLLVPLDANRTFMAYLASTDLDVRLVAYTSNDQFFTASIDKSLGVAGSYQDVDVSGDGVPAGAKAAWLMLANGITGYSYALRPNGATYEYYKTTGGTGIGQQALGFVGLDTNRIYEEKISNLSLDTYLRGYALNDVQVVNPPVALTVDQAKTWRDCTPDIPDALGVVLQIMNAGTEDRIIKVRAKGSSDDEYPGISLRDDDPVKDPAVGSGSMVLGGTYNDDSERVYKAKITSAGAATIIDSYPESNCDNGQNLGAGGYILNAQSFTGNGLSLGSAKFWLKKFNAPTGNIYAKLYALTGTFGTDGHPTGTALATSNPVDIATLTNSYQLIEFIFDGSFTLVNGVHYCISVEYNGGDGSNYLVAGWDLSSSTAPGNVSRYSSGWETYANFDLIFYILSPAQFCFAYSDDDGATWSANIPIPDTDSIDLSYGLTVAFPNAPANYVINDLWTWHYEVPGDFTKTKLRIGDQYFAVVGLGAGQFQAWLENLTDLQIYLVGYMPGGNFPHIFSEYGFKYGVAPFAYDPGATAAIAIGCLYLYMKTGDPRANTWARSILDDLRLNRQSTEYDYLYKTDSFHGWMQAMVAHAFGLAVTGRPGQAYAFSSSIDDLTHFKNMVGQFFAMAGDSKPNVLNADGIPFSFVDSRDSWEFAPNYIMDKEMGSLEALVLMMEAALDYGRLQGDWDWFNRLLAFVVRDNLVVLNQAQIHAITAACDQAGAANLVRLRYADYDRDSSQYVEARNQADLENNGEQVREVDCRYGAPVILEEAETARLLATRLLQRLAPPLESAEVETWLEGVRVELGDTVAVTSDFYGWDREEFTVQGKDLDLGRRRVRLNLSRPLDRADSWAVDVGGSANDAWAIDQASSWDEYWDSRAYVY